MFERLRSWWRSLELVEHKGEGDNPGTVEPAPAAHNSTTSTSTTLAADPPAKAPAHNLVTGQQREPSNARVGSTIAAATQACPATTYPAAAHHQPSASASAAVPVRSKPTPEQQREDFFTGMGEANRYSILEVIGKGSYGIVCSAIDNYTGEKVAIKKITNVFEHVSDATRILREIKLLRLLKHPDIVKIQHIMLPPNARDYQDIYVVFELMETDLHQVIKANDDLTPEHHQFFLYQMLRGLKYLHSAKVFHRDLKPKNILANADCKLKICDFGLARPAFDNMPTVIFWTDYVATRWYRAPELCGSFFAKYSPAIDIWGVGCIFAEVLLGRPLFPGKNVVNQLELITDLLGTPSPDVIAKVRNEKARRFLLSLPPKQGIPFSQVFPTLDRHGLQLLRALLSFDPAERPTAEQALQHPYFAGLHNPAREPTAQPVSKFAFDFDRRKLTMEEVRDLIYAEVLEYHPAAMAAHLSGQLSHRANFSHPNALDNFKRMFLHLENNPGAVLPQGYQGKMRQAAVAAPATAATAAAAGDSTANSSSVAFASTKNKADAAAAAMTQSRSAGNGGPPGRAAAGMAGADVAAAGDQRSNRTDGRSNTSTSTSQGPLRNKTGAPTAAVVAGAGIVPQPMVPQAGVLLSSGERVIGGMGGSVAKLVEQRPAGGQPSRHCMPGASGLPGNPVAKVSGFMAADSAGASIAAGAAAGNPVHKASGFMAADSAAASVAMAQTRQGSAAGRTFAAEPAPARDRQADAGPRQKSAVPVVGVHAAPYVNASAASGYTAGSKESGMCGCGRRSAHCSSCRPYSVSSGASTSSHGSVALGLAHHSAATTSTTSTSGGSMVEAGGPLLQLSPQRSEAADALVYACHATGSFAAPSCSASELLSPQGRHSLQLARIQDPYAAPAPASSTTVSRQHADKGCKLADASDIRVPVTDVPEVPADVWMLGRHSLPGSTCALDQPGPTLGSVEETSGPLSDSSTSNALPAASQPSRERVVVAPPVVPVVLVPNQAAAAEGYGADGGVGFGAAVPAGSAVLSGCEREAVSRAVDEGLPAPRIYRAASIS